MATVQLSLVLLAITSGFIIFNNVFTPVWLWVT